MRRQTKFKFRLYIAGNTPNSAQALTNLTAMCRIHLAHRHEIEIVDVFKEPELALADNIFMTPTLVKVSPLPRIRIVGTLIQELVVLHALGLAGIPV